MTVGSGKVFDAASNDWSQFEAQLIGGVMNVVIVGSLAWGWFRVANLLVPMRSKRQDEIVGLDIPEVGAEDYSDYHLTGASSLAVENPPANHTLSTRGYTWIDAL